MPEMVTVPAFLLASLVWAAESLSNIEPDEKDRAMIQEARRAIEDQAPITALAMMEADVTVDGTQFDGSPRYSDGSTVADLVAEAEAGDASDYG